MADQDLHVQIEALAHEEHTLRQAHSGGTLTDEDRVRLNEVELALDRCWDLLRQRDARRDAGLDPEDAAARPAEVVENYLQ
jgi:hypothetical protein